MAEYVSLAPKSQGLAAVSLFLAAFIFLGTNTHFGRGRMMGGLVFLILLHFHPLHEKCASQTKTPVLPLLFGRIGLLVCFLRE